LADTDEVGELTTPTGAAILTTLAESFGPIPAMTLEGTGFGAGQREGMHRPNLLRVMIGSVGPVGTVDEIAVLQVNLDDATGEIIGHATNRLLDAGALDVYTTSIFMKKNRPATMLTVLTDYARVDQLQQILFEETPTLGIRQLSARRTKLSRHHVTVETKYGLIPIKVGMRGQLACVVKPEYEDCRVAAEKHRVTLREVIDEAVRVWQSKQGA
jgi:uncharacterized protein (DUF111 family)